MSETMKILQMIENGRLNSQFAIFVSGSTGFRVIRDNTPSSRATPTDRSHKHRHCHPAWQLHHQSLRPTPGRRHLPTSLQTRGLRKWKLPDDPGPPVSCTLCPVWQWHHLFFGVMNIICDHRSSLCNDIEHFFKYSWTSSLQCLGYI